MKQKQKMPGTEVKFMTIAEFADYAKLKISTAYKISASGKLPKYKPFGKLTYFLKEDIDALFNASRVPSNGELRQSIELNESF